MLRSADSGPDSLTKSSSPPSSSAAARRRRVVLRRHNHFLFAKPPRTKSSSSRGDQEPEPASSSSHPCEKMNPTKSNTDATSSSSSTPFRRLDGDINREAGMPLTGHDIVGKDIDNKARGVNCSAHGSVSVIGRRREVEDRLTVAPSDFPPTHDFFGVYDGHGGARVSGACRDHLHRFVGDMIERWSGRSDLDWECAMKECFRKMDDEVSAEAEGGGSGPGGLRLGVGVEVVGAGLGRRPPKVRTDGSMALAVVLAEEEIVVANCGDSRAVLYRNGMVIPLSRDQKPDERHRVESVVGRMIDRSFGDRELKPAPHMISEPEVTVTKYCSELDNFLVIASNGLWDVVSNEDACEVVQKCLEGQTTRRRFRRDPTKNPAIAAAMLAELALAKGSKDNVSVIVVEFKNKTDHASRP